jgi:hypothetical protein
MNRMGSPSEEKDMGLPTISESAFLLTELRYTLGQLHVQVLDLDAETRNKILCGDRTIDQTLSDMVASEGQWQTKYAQMLRIAAPGSDSSDAEVPLPVNADDEQPGVETVFEHKRAQTIAMLEKVSGDWPEELLDAVKQQVAEDRRLTTDIAECRKTYFAQDRRPDLEEPLQAPGTH